MFLFLVMKNVFDCEINANEYTKKIERMKSRNLKYKIKTLKEFMARVIFIAYQSTIIASTLPHTSTHLCVHNRRLFPILKIKQFEMNKNNRKIVARVAPSSSSIKFKMKLINRAHIQWLRQKSFLVWLCVFNFIRHSKNRSLSAVSIELKIQTKMVKPFGI